MARRGYTYHGPEHLLREVEEARAGRRICSLRELEEWLAAQPDDAEGAIFTVATDGELRLAPRRSEHVVCAQGRPVLAAGEITFARDGLQAPRVVDVTNQSTGYCPEPESWPAVAEALRAIGVTPPERYTREFAFRRCTECGEVNLVKDAWFYCVACGSPLPSAWNIDTLPRQP